MKTQIKFISLDLDGTIIDEDFVNHVWLKGIPKLYAKKAGITFNQSYSLILSEYNKIGRKRLEWYDLDYWIKKFELSVKPLDLLLSFQNKIKIYPEVYAVLKELNKKYKLILLTNARREFLSLELKKTGIKNFFFKIFSSTSDFKMVKSTIEVYRKVCDILKINPNEIVHIGDDEELDFLVPKQLGIKTFYLDRTSKKSGNFIIHNLKNLLDLI